MKPRQIDDCFDRLDEIACHAAAIPPYKVLAEETKLAPNYLKNVMSRLIRIRRTGKLVHRETLLRSLSNEKEFDALMERLRRGEPVPRKLTRAERLAAVLAELRIE